MSNFSSNYNTNSNRNKNFPIFRSRKLPNWQVSDDIKFDRKISERFDPAEAKANNDFSKAKIDYYRQPSKEISHDPRDSRSLPKPIKEFKEALINVNDSHWIRGEPPKHVFIDGISSKQVKSELNLYARLEDHFHISENDLLNVNLLQIDSENLCASVLFVSGFKAWEFVRSFSNHQTGFNWSVRIDPSARYFERIKADAYLKDERNKEKYRENQRDRVDARDTRNQREARDLNYYKEEDRYEHKNQRHNTRRMACSAFVPCLKIPFSCEESLKFRLDNNILLSLFPLNRFPSISGVEEGSSSWHVHFGREIDVVEADRMLQIDNFEWAGHQFYFEKWDLMKNDIPWDIPDHYNKPKETINFDFIENFVDFTPQPLKGAFEEEDEEGDYMKLPKFKKKQRLETENNREGAREDTEDTKGSEVNVEEFGTIKMKIKRKPIKKVPFIPPPIMKPESNTEKIIEAVEANEIAVESITSTTGCSSLDVKVDVEIECPVLISGSVRTEGFFQLDISEKRRVKFNGILEAFSSSSGPLTSSNASTLGSNDSNSGRSSRAQNRRPLLQTISNVTMDLFKVSPLQSTQKLVSLRNSSIHSYGLVVMESAEPGDLIIEYVGELVRASVANIREWKYEREYRGDGIASSYLFRLDGIMVIDASHQGNLARFINHSCEPNCFAKTITLNGSKRIVLYAKKSIRPGEEITYDYKFPTEKDPKKKVKCLCGSSSCRKYLN